MSINCYSKIELFVIDLTGLIFVFIWNEYLYTLVVVEISCHYAIEHLLYSKEETRPTIQDIIALLER